MELSSWVGDHEMNMGSSVDINIVSAVVNPVVSSRHRDHVLDNTHTAMLSRPGVHPFMRVGHTLQRSITYHPCHFTSCPGGALPQAPMLPIGPGSMAIHMYILPFCIVIDGPHVSLSNPAIPKPWTCGLQNEAGRRRGSLCSDGTMSLASRS